MQSPLSILATVPLFSGLGESSIAKLSENVEARKVQRRDVVYLPGDPGDSLFILHEGRIKISKVTRDGKALTLSYVGPNEIFGESSLVDGGPREEMAEAMEHSVFSELNLSVFESILAQNALLGLRLTKLLAKRRLDLETKLETLVFRDVSSKLAELLLELAQENGVDDPRGTMIALKITHQELANLIGSTRETVSLTLSQFRRKELLTTEGRKVIVTNEEGLRALY